MKLATAWEQPMSNFYLPNATSITLMFYNQAQIHSHIMSEHKNLDKTNLVSGKEFHSCTVFRSFNFL